LKSVSLWPLASNLARRGVLVGERGATQAPSTSSAAALAPLMPGLLSPKASSSAQIRIRVRG
jgi:hypothetical protein